MKKVIAIAVSSFLLMGCSTSTSQRVGVATEAYIAATNSMTVLARAGELDREEAETFESYRAPVDQYLDLAIQDLLDGDGSDEQAANALDILIPLLDQMLAAQQEAEDE